MSQTPQAAHVSRITLYQILRCIDALFQMNIINAPIRNELANLARKGLSDRFDALYAKCMELPEHPIVEELKELIIFQ